MSPLCQRCERYPPYSIVVFPARRLLRRDKSSLYCNMANVTDRTAALGATSTTRCPLARAANGPLAEKSYASAQMCPASGVRNATRSAASPLSQSAQSPAVREHPEAPLISHSPGREQSDRRERFAVRALHAHRRGRRELRRARRRDSIGVSTERDVVEPIDPRLHREPAERRVHGEIPCADACLQPCNDCPLGSPTGTGKSGRPEGVRTAIEIQVCRGTRRASADTRRSSRSSRRAGRCLARCR